MAYNSAEELTLLWRAMLVASGSGAVAETVAVATVEQCRPWSDQPSRLEIWQAGFAELEAENERSPVQLLSLDDVGHRSTDVRAIADFLHNGPHGRRELLLGHHVAGFTGDDLRAFVGDDRMDDEQLSDRISYESKVAAQSVVVKPEHWNELLSLVKCPVRFGPLVRRGSRSWRFVGIGAAVTAVGLLFLLLFGFNRGTPPGVEGVVEGGPGSDSGRVGENSADDRLLRPDLPCSVVAGEASAVQVSPVYQRNLQVRSLSEALGATDLVLRGPIAVEGLDGGDVRFVAANPEILFGWPVVPETFVLESRIDRTEGVVSTDELVADLAFADAVVFLREEDGRWEVSEAGGLWAGCGDGGGVPVGADWPVGPGWPTGQNPQAIGDTIGELVRRNAAVELAVMGERAVGGFQLFDGRSVVLEIPAGLEPVGPVDVQIQASPNVLAFIDGPFLDLTIRPSDCDPAIQARTPHGVCSSDGQTMIEIGSPLNVSRAWLDRLDAHVIDSVPVVEPESGETPDPTPIARLTRNDELIAIDPLTLAVRWRAPLAPRPDILAAGQGEVLVASVDLIRAFDATTGTELWVSDVDITAPPAVVAGGWLIQAAAGADEFLALVDGRTGELRWWTEQRQGRLTVVSAGPEVIVGQELLSTRGQVFGIDPEDGRMLWEVEIDAPTDIDQTSMIAVDQERSLLVTLSPGGQLRLFELPDGRLRWTNAIPSAESIDGIWLSTMTVNSRSGGLVTVGLADGFILPP